LCHGGVGRVLLGMHTQIRWRGQDARGLCAPCGTCPRGGSACRAASCARRRASGLCPDGVCAGDGPLSAGARPPRGGINKAVLRCWRCSGCRICCRVTVQRHHSTLQRMGANSHGRTHVRMQVNSKYNSKPGPVSSTMATGAGLYTKDHQRDHESHIRLDPRAVFVLLWPLLNRVAPGSSRAARSQ